MKISNKLAAALTVALTIPLAPSLAQAYSRTIMGFAAQPVLVPDAGLTHDDASGIKTSDWTTRHQVLYPIALDQIPGSFTAKVAVTASPSTGAEAFCWSIAYRADGTWTDAKDATATIDGFQELNIPAVTVPAGGYASVSCWLRGGRRPNPNPSLVGSIPTPASIHRVMIQQ